LEQNQDGDSLKTQIDAIESYCQQKGLQLVGIIKDAGVSGGKLLSERVGGQELIKMLESKQVTGVVFSQLDRGFRNSGDAILTIDQWVKRGVDLHIINWHGGSTLDTRDPMAKLQLGRISVVADFERSMISARTKETLRAKKKRGEVYSPTPLGYIAEAGRLVADATEQATIATACSQCGRASQKSSSC
jgi:DNA invertase Pin-like site-specific DNA recombinase